MQLRGSSSPWVQAILGFRTSAFFRPSAFGFRVSARLLSCVPHPARPMNSPELAKRPRLAVGASQQFAGFGIVEDDLGRYVPLDLAADQHRDEAEMAGNGGMMGGLDGGDGGLAGLDAVNEVAHVAFGLVELDLVTVVGNLREPIEVGS